MKIIKVIGHPVLLMSLFLLILISGEQFGGFYLLYLLMGVPYGAPHAIIALIGLSILFTGYKVYRKRPNVIKPLLYLLGDILIVLALITFFSKSKGYNDNTFREVIPLISFALFGLCLISNLFYSAVLIIKSIGNNKKPMVVAS